MNRVNFGYTMANVGMHLRTGDEKLVGIFRAALAAGLAHSDAFAVAQIAYTAKHNQLRHIELVGSGFFRRAFDRLANGSPRSLWAYARVTLGAYCSDEDIKRLGQTDYQGWHAWASAIELAEANTASVNVLEGG